jgi:hypothetical protein
MLNFVLLQRILWLRGDLKVRTLFGKKHLPNGGNLPIRICSAAPVREKRRKICLLQSGFPSVKAKEEAKEEHVAVFQPSNPIHKSCNP